MPSSRGSSWPRNRTHALMSPSLQGGFLPLAPPGKPLKKADQPKNWCCWTVVLEKILESPLDCKEIKPVNPKENQPWIFIGRTDAEIPILWPTDVKSQLFGKDSDAGKGQDEKEVTEDERVGCHHWLNGHEFEQTSGRQWRMGKPEVLQSMGLQGIRNHLATEQQWIV